MDNIISCRLSSYGKFHERAWEHLRQIGVYHIELEIPSDEEKDDIHQKMNDNGLKAASMQCRLDVPIKKNVEKMRGQFDIMHEFNTNLCFLSVKTDNMEKVLVWKRLRALGNLAAQHGVTVALETHPDLMTNAEVALETFANVEHPNIKMNFDTANIYYYNRGLDTLTELKKVIDHVASVHLKDSRGEFEAFDFPVLGTGIVPFPQVFMTLNDSGLYGPFTMELEGTNDIDPDDEEGVINHVAESVAYLKRIGAMEE